MILKGPIKFQYITEECVNPCSEVALDMDVHALYAQALLTWDVETVRRLTNHTVEFDNERKTITIDVSKR